MIFVVSYKIYGKPNPTSEGRPQVLCGRDTVWVTAPGLEVEVVVTPYFGGTLLISVLTPQVEEIVRTHRAYVHRSSYER
ncbi:MAG: hypothetical protein WCA20_11380 [Candidatus Sulfotelmatobacter sp.]